ncbi:hypothetical protein SPRG_15026 [Saprolegnia parasitica CBS 223.65]|uniref:Uncharacterized protein n=1 Tax=Saprolegnia parasitica (strain CBS 223.65) TaxID=695850 RepID=A0A067BLN1_SAPPC|nr:hypothetical protein SPRG_15026 [Saprolegnia parasitica CBS 223.65]KDO19113.1 hypothetical protein SPRG_15026 [Saprolegnia parasitica CBS 223.65]|eukprot:XP_012210185.1 hypothetical protein SPRG_15026 [Saprolegnia parasitica CBS 223.65]
MASSPGLLRFDATARNNKKGGQKNLRCFPNCCNGLHAATGFCGGPVAVHLDASDATKSYLLLAEFVPVFKGAPQSTLSIGHMYVLETLRAQANKDADPLVPYFAGHSMQTSYYFNPAKKGWHYGWMSNKHTSDREHVLCVHLLEEVSETFGQCVDSLASPPFTVHCRRRSKTESPVVPIVVAKKRPHSPSSSVTAPSSPSSDEGAGRPKRQMLAPASTPASTPDWKDDDDESLCIDALFQSEVLDLITNSTCDFAPPPPSTEATLWNTLMDDDADDAELLDLLLPTPSAPPMTEVPRYQTYFTPQRNAAPVVGRKRPVRIPVDLKYPNGPLPIASSPATSASHDATTVAPMPPCRRHDHRRRSHSSDDAGPPVAKSCGLLWSIVQLAFCLTMFVHFVGHIFFPTYNAYAPATNNVRGGTEDPTNRLTPFLVDCPPPSMTCVRDGFGLQELASCVHHIADRCATEATAEITIYSIDGNTTQLACDGMTACASQLQAFLPSMGAAELEHHKEHYRREHEQQIYTGMQYKFILFMAMCTLISFFALQRSFQKCLKKCQWFRHRRLHPDDHIA